jgi:hypothetical protein
MNSPESLLSALRHPCGCYNRYATIPAKTQDAMSRASLPAGKWNFADPTQLQQRL